MLRQATQRRLVIPAKPVNTCFWYMINRPTIAPTVEAGGQCQRHVLPVMETDPSAAGVKQRGFPKYTAVTFTFRIFLLHFAFDGQASQEATVVWPPINRTKLQKVNKTRHICRKFALARYDRR